MKDNSSQVIYAGMRLYKRPVTSSPGSKFTLFGIYESLYHDDSPDQIPILKEFRGLLPNECPQCIAGIIDTEWCHICGGEGFLYRNVAFKSRYILTVNRRYESEFYQKSQTFLPFRFDCQECENGCDECNGTGNALSEWLDYQLPALHEMDESVSDALRMAAINSDFSWANGDESNDTWAWVKATERKVDFKRTFYPESGEEITYSPKYYTGIVLYPSQTEWLADQEVDIDSILARLRGILE